MNENGIRNDDMKNGRLTIMVSSAVYGYQEFLDRIYDLLMSMGYEVWMSHKGTIPVDSSRDTIECCLDAVRKCDLFLCIITGTYGKTMRDGFSATHLEMQEAIKRNKLRWFLVDDRVVFARSFLKHLNYDGSNIDRQRLSISKGWTQFDNLRLVEMYEEACNVINLDSGTPSVNWVQTYENANAALLFAHAQFSRYLELEEILRKNLADKALVQNRIKETKEGK